MIGGGIVGVSTAYYLARRGHRVTLIEKGSIDAGASTGNAGIIALGHPPIPRPGLVAKTLRWMLDRESPLYVPPRLNLDLMRWMMAFRRACTAEHFRSAMDVMARMGTAAGDCFAELVRDESIDCEYRQLGWYDVFRTEEGRHEGSIDADILREHGFRVDDLDGDALREREPAFHDDVIGATHYADSGCANPRRFIVELADRARAHGATIRENANAIRIRVENGRFRDVRLVAGTDIEGDRLVIAAGVWSSEIARSIGLRVPMQAGKGYHVMITPPPSMPSTSCVLNERHVAVTPMEGTLRLAGTVELSGINHDMVERRIDMLVRSARLYFRELAGTQVVSKWCGLRPCTSDGLPVLGPTAIDGVFLATGHAKMGFTLGPISGLLLSELILDGAPSIPIEALSPDRYARETVSA